MKKLLFTAFLLCMVSLTQSQWVSNFGGDVNSDVNFTNAKGNAVTTDANGYSYVTGYTNETASQNDVVTIKYTPQGDTCWVRSYNGNANGADEGTGICTDASGNVYVVGFATYTNKSFDVILIKYSANGTLLWVNQYSSVLTPVTDKGMAIAVDAAGYIYITGLTTGSDTYTDIFVRKCDPNGTEIWTRLEDGTSNLNAEGLALAISTQGNVYVAGFVTVSGTNTDIAVLKYNSAGVQQWMKTINGNGNSEDKAWGIVVDELDNVYIGGYSTNSSLNTDCFTAKLDQFGSILWSRTYNGGGNQTDKAWGIVVDTDGSVYITGQETDASLNVNYITVKYTSTGADGWIAVYNGTGNGEDIASSIAVLTNLDNTKSVVVTGKSWGTNQNYDYATVRYSNSTGNQTQVNRYSFTGNTNDLAKDIAISPTKKVIITGFSQLITENSVESSFISTMSLDWAYKSKLETNSNIPTKFSLKQNYPNPFNPSTNISFDLSEGGKVELTVYDMLGRVNTVLINQYLSAGTYNINFSNPGLSSGIYFYELKSGAYRDIKKMTLVK